MTHFQRTEQATLARATLEIDPGAPAPRGTLTSADGRRVAFAGWSEFAVAVEDFRAGSYRASPDVRTAQAGSGGERGETP